MRQHHVIAASLVAAVALFTLGCADDQQVFGQGEGDRLPAKESWDWGDVAGQTSGPTVQRNFDALPKSGRAEREVWPSTHWPTYRDGINERWLSTELSPAEKYDMAFNNWVPSEAFMDLQPYRGGSDCGEYDKAYYESLGPLASYISANMGNGQSRNGADDDGDGMIDECDDRDGVPVWWGLSHAWVSAAMLEDRPRRTIEHNGVTFHPGDLEALIIAAYQKVGADVLETHCRDSVVQRDQAGKAVLDGCKPLNAGDFHITMANHLGLNKIPFGEDRTYDGEVWKRPVIAYEITNQRDVSTDEALRRIGAAGGSFRFSEEAVRLVEVHADTLYLSESGASVTPVDPSMHERVEGYNYILEIDEEGEIVGGQWTVDNRGDRPDFIWAPRRAQMSSVPNLDLEHVRDLIRRSRAPAGSEADEPGMGLGTGEELLFEDNPNWVIPDNDSSGVQAEIIIPDGVRGKVTIGLQVFHTFLNDLFIEVVAPTGERWTLFDHEETFELELIQDYVLDPQPTTNLGGTWRLNIADLAEIDEGILEAWKIKVLQ